MARRIGIFCDSYRPENKAVAVRMYHFAQAFASVGYDVTVTTTTKEKEPSPFPVRIQTNWTTAPSNLQSNVVRLLSELVMGVELFLRILFKRYDVVLLSSPPFLASSLGALASKIKGIPFIFDVRDEYPEVYFAANLLLPSSLAGKILLNLESGIYRNSLLVISVTEGICRRITQKCPGATVRLVRNGYDATRFFPEQKHYETFTVVFHGNMGKFQDPDLILRLAAKAQEERRNIEFLIIGWGNNDSAVNEQELTNVRYMGMVNYEDISATIARAHLGISFRTNDLISKNAFPVKLYEYIGVAIPAIITPKSEAGKFFEANEIGYEFDPDEWQNIYDRIIYLSEHPDEISRLRRNLLKKRGNFSRNAISDDLVKTVTALLDLSRN